MPDCGYIVSVQPIYNYKVSFFFAVKIENLYAYLIPLYFTPKKPFNIIIVNCMMSSTSIDLNTSLCYYVIIMLLINLNIKHRRE